MAVHRPDPVLLERQIASLAAQSESGWVCLIGIDGIDAGTADLVDELTRQDSRFQVREYPMNVGVYHHFERLLSEIPDESRWVALADQDDVWHPTKLTHLVGHLEAPGVTAAMCQARVVDRAGQLLGYTDRKSVRLVDLILRNQVTGSLTVFTAGAVRRALPFPPSTADAVHDHWLGVCASALGDVRVSQQHLQDYVQHATNVLGEDAPTSIREALRSVRRAGGVRAHLDTIAHDQWGWRVNVARGLEVKGLVDSGAEAAFVHTVARGQFSRGVCRTVFASWRGGSLRGRGLASTLVSALWFSTHRSPSRETGGNARSSRM